MATQYLFIGETDSFTRGTYHFLFQITLMTLMALEHFFCAILLHTCAFHPTELVTCTIAYIAPQIQITPSIQSFLIPIYGQTRQKLLVELGIKMAVGTEMAGVTTAILYYHKLSLALSPYKNWQTP
jgi:hypothetical protein